MLQGGTSMYLLKEMHVEADIWARMLKGQNYIMDEQSESSESSDFSDYEDLFHEYGWKLPFWRLFGVMQWEDEPFHKLEVKHRALDIVCAFLGPYNATHIQENHTQIGDMTQRANCSPANEVTQGSLYSCQSISNESLRQTSRLPQ